MKRFIVIMLSVVIAVGVCGCEYFDDYETNGHNTGTTSNFSFGRVNGNVYENDFIGIRYEADDGWNFYSEEQIKEVNGVVDDMAGEEYKELLKNSNGFCDMIAKDIDGMNNVNINIEKADTTNTSYDISQIYENIIPVLESSYENMGIYIVSHEMVQIEVDGKTMNAVYIICDDNDVPMYSMLFQNLCNGYIATMTVTTYTYDNTLDLIDNFSWI